MTPEAAISKCPECGTWIVAIAGHTLCECVVNGVYLHHRPRLQRLHALLCDQRTMCDRCDLNPAYRTVQCHAGCYHAQCWGCAEATKQERLDELEYERQVAQR